MKEISLVSMGLSVLLSTVACGGGSARSDAGGKGGSVSGGGGHGGGSGGAVPLDGGIDASGGTGSGGTSSIRDASPRDGIPGRADLEGSWYAIEAAVPDGGAPTHWRLRFDGDRYYFVTASPTLYCGEVGTATVDGDKVTFQVDHVQGFGPCVEGPPRVEALAWNETGIALTRDGIVKNYVRVRQDVARVFVTTEAHNGNFRGDPALTGTTAIEKADDFCNRSLAKPDGGTYRALLVDGTNRSALPPKNWVLVPNTTYFQAEGVTNVFTVNAQGVTGGMHNYFENSAAIRGAWGGLAFTSTANATCEGWTTAYQTVSAYAWKVDNSQFGGSGASCDMQEVLICVGQPPTTGPGADGGADGGGDAGVGVLALQGSWASVDDATNPKTDGNRRIRFDGNTYVLVSDTSFAYCGEVGTFEQPSESSISFVPKRIDGQGRCVLEPARTETVGITADALALTRDGKMVRYTRAPIVPKVFLTFDGHNGDFAGDATLAGGNAIAKADSFCNASSAKPDTQIYKAMIEDVTNRDAASRKDWVFAQDTTYHQADGVHPVLKTEATALVINATDSGRPLDAFGNFNYYWGVNEHKNPGIVSTTSCNGWTTADPMVLGPLIDGGGSLRHGNIVGNCGSLTYGLACVSAK